MQRLELIEDQLLPNQTSSKKGTIRSDKSLQVTDNRTGQKYTIPVKTSRESCFIQAKDIQKIKADGVTRVYDPAFTNTITCTSKICYIDGDKGVLEYRGYPIEQLAGKSNFLEVAYLIINGELPNTDQFNEWNEKIMSHTMLHNDALNIMKNFRYDAHPMGMLMSTISALSTFQPGSNPALAGYDIYQNLLVRNKEIYRIIGQIGTIAANAYRCRIGRPFNSPKENCKDYVENFLYMMDRLNENQYKPHPKIVKAMDILFILHAEHELNCSTAMVRHLASSGVDVYTAIAGSIAALYGPKHGGANEAVLRMLTKIGDVKKIPQFIEDVKNRKELLFGFGHRVYKNYDPRARIVKNLAYEVFEIIGKENLIDIALELEKVALSDEYFIKRKLYPNVDFYTGVIYKVLGFPTDMFPVLFAIPRTVGWLAHWVEFLQGDEQNIYRPRQNYQGYKKRDYVEMGERKENNFNLSSYKTSTQKRRETGSHE